VQPQPSAPKAPQSVTQNITINTGVVDLSMLGGLATGEKGAASPLEITTRKVEEKALPKLPVEPKKSPTPTPPLPKPVQNKTPTPDAKKSTPGSPMLKIPGTPPQPPVFAGNDAANLQPALKRSPSSTQKGGDQEVVDLQSLQKTHMTLDPTSDDAA
jgi:hypothetical protein